MARRTRQAGSGAGPRQAIGYARVSTDGQAQSGLSLAAQERKVRSYCEVRDYELGGVFVDAGVSGGKPAEKRPQLRDALDQVCRTGAVLVVTKLDRLGRNTIDVLNTAERLSKCGAALAILDLGVDTTTPGGEFALTVMAALAQMERRQGADRTRAALAEKRERGEQISRFPPYGFDFEPTTITTRGGERKRTNKLVKNADEQKVLRRIKRWRSNGDGYKAIARKLNDGGVPPKRGKKWHPSAIQNIVAREGQQ